MLVVIEPVYVILWVALVVVIGMPSAYLIARMAGRGWFSAKLDYQRRLMSGIRGDKKDG